MCGRFQQSRSAAEVAATFRTTGPTPNTQPSWNIAPTQNALAVRRHPESGDRHLNTLRWGLVPRWAKDATAGARAINARAETVATLPTFRDAFRKRRCLVPATGFYEWLAAPAPKAPKQPYCIAAADRGMLAFAGLWEGWRSPDGEILRTFTIVTTEANQQLRPIHTRMPVMLPDDAWDAWLDPDTPAEDLVPLFGPDAPPELALWPVSPRVGRVSEDDPNLVEPIEPAQP
jgi:putative SOS response-associated peptidase YedK